MTEDPLRLCIVGLGHIGRVHATSIQEVGALQLIAGCDTNPALAEVLPDGVRFHDKLDDALAASDIDVVVVATPNQTHNSIARKALDAGRHVIVEKPAASDPQEMQALQDSARASQRLLWFALHASTGSEVLWAEQHLRDEQDRYGELSGFHCCFMDPYVDAMNKTLSHTHSLQTPWRDSGINALSVLLRMQPSLKLEATGLRRSQQHGETSCVLSETAHFRFCNAGYGCVETAWDQRRNHKSTELFFAESGLRLRVDHSEQTVERWNGRGEREVLAAFSGERLLNHYLNLFSEAASDLLRGGDNTAEGVKAHNPYFAAMSRKDEA